MINLETFLVKVLKYFKKTNTNNKSSTKIFINKILHIKPMNNKEEQLNKTQINFICEGDAQTSDFEETETETEANDDDDDKVDNGVEVQDDDNGNDDGDGGDNDGNRVDGVTMNGDFSNMKHLIGETK